MTLLQLRYIMEIYNSGSINQAAKNLFMSQSTVSAAIKEVEEELGIMIFRRTNRGITVTEEGQEFIANIRPLLEQEKKIRKYYKTKGKEEEPRFAISLQRYAFCTEAFVHFVKKQTTDAYDFKIMECDMGQVIEDVSTRKSELGILYFSDITQKYLEHIFRDARLEFRPIADARPKAFFNRHHPLAAQKSVSLAELGQYPCVVFEKDEATPLGFAEEVGMNDIYEYDRLIKINDRATLYNIIANTDAVSTGSGILPKGYVDERIVARPISDEIDNMHIGYIKIEDAALSDNAKEYIRILKEILKDR